MTPTMFEVFVFGSNLAGRHGAGAALEAYTRHGAKLNVGVGLTGMSYAIPTKGCKLETLPRPVIQLYVDQFIDYANVFYINSNPVRFKVTRIGCGLAGFKDKEIAPLFSDAPPNCYFDTKWSLWLTNLHNYWGTYD